MYKSSNIKDMRKLFLVIKFLKRKKIKNRNFIFKVGNGIIIVFGIKIKKDILFRIIFSNFKFRYFF